MKRRQSASAAAAEAPGNLVRAAHGVINHNGCE